jgi:hypothetical protein
MTESDERAQERESVREGVRAGVDIVGFVFQFVDILAGDLLTECFLQ